MTKSILVDGREFVLGRRTGIGPFLEGLLLAITAKHTDWSCTVVLNEIDALPESLQGKVEVLQSPKYLEWFFPKLAEGSDLFLSPYPKLPVRNMPCPCVHTIHDVFYLTHPAYQGNRLRRTAALWRLKHAVSKADLTWFDSLTSKHETQGLTGEINHTSHIRFPSIEASFKPDRRIKKKDFFLFVGNGLPHKNVQTLLGAINQTDLVLKCVGIQPEIAEKLAHVFAVNAAQVEFLQGVDDKALLKLYRQTKALLQPSTAEGFGYPPLEAMACATPAIVSDIPVLRETTNNLSTYVAPHDAKAWQQAMLSFDADAESISQGLVWAEQHQGEAGWAAHILDIEQLVQN